MPLKEKFPFIFMWVFLLIHLHLTLFNKNPSPIINPLCFYITFSLSFVEEGSLAIACKVMSLSSSEMMNKKMFHHRRTSKDQLEVFEASRYFSDYNEAFAANSFGTKYTQKVKKKDKGWIKGRISLDMQVKNILNLPQNSYSVEKQVTKEKKYNKQPSSPGGRLASFLNSLFSHSSSKKKKSKHFEQSMEDTEDESRISKRRISISHFRSSNVAATDAKFLYSTSLNNSGLRTPPPHVQTPTKSYKELLSFSKFNRHVKSSMEDKRIRNDDQGGCCNLEEKQKNKILNNTCSSEKDRVWVEKLVADDQEMKLRKFDDDDQIDYEDGGESDSSSDLFELQICDLDYYSNGLPVYESTNIDNIKRRNSVSNGVC